MHVLFDKEKNSLRLKILNRNKKRVHTCVWDLFDVFYIANEKTIVLFFFTGISETVPTFFLPQVVAWRVLGNWNRHLPVLSLHTTPEPIPKSNQVLYSLKRWFFHEKNPVTQQNRETTNFALNKYICTYMYIYLPSL
jgi:hypothetical protein